MTNASSTPPPGPVALLPVGQTVADAYRFTLRRIDQVIVAALVPFCLSLAIGSLGVGAAGSPFEFVLTLIEVFAYAIFAVAWHRALLMEERPPLIPRLGRRQLRFWLMTLLLGLMIGLLVGLPALLFGGGMAMMGGGGPGGGIALLVLPLLLVAFYLAARFSFVFPAAAVDENFGLLESWRTTAGNAWRLIGAYLLALVPMLAAAAILMVIAGTLLGVSGMMDGGPDFGGGVIGTIVFIALAAVLNYVFAAVFVSLLSLAFRTCTGWIPDTGGGPPPGPHGWHGRDGGAHGDAGFDDERRD